MTTIIEIILLVLTLMGHVAGDESVHYEEFPVLLPADFSYFVPTVGTLGLPEQYTGYAVQLWGMSLHSDAGVIAVNYQYRKPGSIAYELEYGVDPIYNVAIVYEGIEGAACNLLDIEHNLSDFVIEDGIYVVTPNNAVFALPDYCP